MRKSNTFMGTIILACLLILAVFILCKVGAHASEEKSRENIAIRECEFRKEIKALLKDQGFTNPGITMTRVTEGNESTYTVSIYVPSYLHMSEADKQVLLTYLERIDLSVDNSEVIFNFT